MSEETRTNGSNILDQDSVKLAQAEHVGSLLNVLLKIEEKDYYEIIQDSFQSFSEELSIIFSSADSASS